MRQLLVMMIAIAALAASAADKPKRARDAPHAPPPRGPACELLSTDDVRRITGRQGYGDGTVGDRPGEGLGGGTSCQWSSAGWTESLPLVSVVLIPKGAGAGYVEQRKSDKPRPGCKQDRVADLGGLAFFEDCPSSTTLPLFVQGRGANDLVVALQLDRGASSAPSKPVLVALAKAALAKLK